MEKKEAMKILKDFHEKSALFSVRTALDTIFPELKESEEEKIRKSIIAILNNYVDNSNTFKPKMLAWLEKQGKKSPFNKERLMEVAKPEKEEEKDKPLDAAENLVKAVVNAHPTFNFKVGVPDKDECPKWFEKQGERYIACSEEQMKVLDEVLNFAANHESPYWNDYIFGTLNNLIRQLKKQKTKVYDEAINCQFNYTRYCNGTCILKNNEQKPADKIEPKFHEGDWVVISTSDGRKVVQVVSIEYFPSGQPRYITSEGRWFGNGTKARLLTDKDTETITLPESKAIVNKIKSLSEEDALRLEEVICMIEANGRWVRSDDAVKLNLDWLKSLKQRLEEQR